MIAAGKAIFVGTGATVNRSVYGIDLVTLSLNEPDAKIEVYVAWRKGEDSPAVLSFLESVRRVYELSEHSTRDSNGAKKPSSKKR
jgi:DNA-binding transcriptional LysR family regulator